MTAVSRREFVGQAAAGLAAATMMGRTGHAQRVWEKAQWKIEDFNTLVHLPRQIKQVIDVSAIGEGKFLGNARNSLNALHYGFGIPVDQIKIAVALHGPANMLNYDDYVWDKYQIGEWLKVTDPKTGKPATRNIFYPSRAGAALQYTSKDINSDDSLYQDGSIQGLQARGVQFMSCHTANEEQARVLVKLRNLDQDPEVIVKDMLAHTVPGVMVVAGMVAAIALLQTQGHYSYLTI